jgi:urate oxidase / 2-oxo-4-hydroxy-4-carboxy-5-ureidoimidazoline decarboxylase
MANVVAADYGKDAVSVYRTDGDRLFACEVRLVARGPAFEPSYTRGDNSMVVATDSMKNFVHSTALEYRGETLDGFVDEVATRFLDRYEHVEEVEVVAREASFARRSGVVFQRLYDDVPVSELVLGRGSRSERSGLERLHLVKLSGSAFAGFVRDEHTTLPESADRPLFVHMNVHWSPRAPHERVRDSVVATFADFRSESIQHLVHEMGVRLLDGFGEIETVKFLAENRLWDTACEDDGATVYTDARPPFGVITLTLSREA